MNTSGAAFGREVGFMGLVTAWPYFVCNARVFGLVTHVCHASLRYLVTFPQLASLPKGVYGTPLRTQMGSARGNCPGLWGPEASAADGMRCLPFAM